MKYFLRYSLIFLLTGSTLFSSEIKFDYHYGLHDFTVGHATHTVGVNAGMYWQYQRSKAMLEKASFEVFVEYDDKGQDPDHIPIWFQGYYGLDRALMSVGDWLSIYGTVSVDWKMNTVSSVEQYLKAGMGLAGTVYYQQFELHSKVLVGMYYLEIDDDVPLARGFTRSDLDSGYRSAIGYKETLRWTMSQRLFLDVGMEAWYEKGVWLEKRGSLVINYDLDKGKTLIFSIENIEYNLKDFQKNTLDILPWNEDTLFKLVLRMPF